MKGLKRVCRWILFSVLLQTAVLAYLNYVYIPGRGNFTVTAYDVQENPVKNRSYELPDGASGIKVSHDGLYAAFMVDGRLEIADVDRKKIIKKADPSGGSFSYYRWLPDRDMLIYTIKEPEGKSGCIRILTYDIGAELDRSYPDVKNLPEGSTVIDLQLSPLTNVVYFMVKTSDTRVRIYKFDIMDDLELIMKADLGIIIRETMYSDNLIYQPEGGKIIIRDGRTGEKSDIPVKEAALLLAVDDMDFIYAASTDEAGRVTQIHYGKIGQQEDWRSVRPIKPTYPDDVFIAPQGNIFQADRQNRTIRSLSDNRLMEYTGALLAVTDDYVVSVDEGKLKLKVIK